MTPQDRFVLIQVIRGIQERIDRYNGYADKEVLEELRGMMGGLKDVVKELCEISR